MSPSSLALLSTLGWMLTTSLAVSAHGGEEPEMAMPGMDHGSGDDDSMSMGMSMWFHITRGDNLLFKEWVPTTAGAFAGACIALIVLAIVDRFLAALRATAEAKWAYQAQNMAPLSSSTYNDFTPEPLNSNKDVVPVVAPRVRDLLHVRGPTPAWVQPRKISRDALRGLLHGIQGGLGLVLMLAVMSFNVWFLLSVVIGLALGEFAFGRFGASHARHGGASAQGCC